MIEALQPPTMAIAHDNYPAATLIREKRDHVARARARMVDRVATVAPELLSYLTGFLERRAAHGWLPSVGEAWPWLLAELTGIDAEIANRVGPSWLALYWYTLIIDSQCDNFPAPVPPGETLMGTLLFELGLCDMLSLTTLDESRQLVRSSIHEALRNQMRDVQARTVAPSTDAQWAASALKNSGFVAGAAALASMANVDPSTLLRFSRSVLLALQHLDDLADYQGDFTEGNPTPLLTLARERGALETAGMDRLAVTAGLLTSGALSTVLRETRDILTRARGTIGHGNAPAVTPSSRFLMGLVRELTRCERYVRFVETRFDEASEVARGRYLIEIERRVLIVAQHS